MIAVVLLSLLPLSWKSLPDRGEAWRFMSSPSWQVSCSHVTRPRGQVTCPRGHVTGSGPSVSAGCPVRRPELRGRSWELADGSTRPRGIHVGRDCVSHQFQPQMQDFALTTGAPVQRIPVRVCEERWRGWKLESPGSRVLYHLWTWLFHGHLRCTDPDEAPSLLPFSFEVQRIHVMPRSSLMM